MKVILENGKKILITKLPQNIDGNYWLKDSDNKNLVNIEAENNKWILKNNMDIKILNSGNNIENLSLFDANKISSVELNNFSHGTLYDINKGIEYKYYSLPTYDDTLVQIELNKKTLQSITIGKNKNSTISINNELFADKQLEITCENEQLHIVNNNINLPMFINRRISTSKSLLPGDYVFIGGFYLCVYGNILVFNNPNNTVTFNENILKRRIIPENADIDYSEEIEPNIELYSKDEYFGRPPRFRRIIEPKEYKIDIPPQKNNQEEMPIILTIGPMIMMGMVSMMSGVIAIIKVMNNETTFKESYQPIITSIAMLVAMILFPFIQKIYTKYKKKQREKKRVKRYNEYIEEKKIEINKELELERQILLENFVPLNEVEKVVINRDRTLWERKIEHFDFLSVRLGIGTMPSYITVTLPEEHFEIEKDDLRKISDKLVTSSKYIENVPIVLSLLEKRFVSIIGNNDYLKNYIEGIILQLISYQSYDNLNIVILSNNENSDFWKRYNSIPHFWDSSKEIRYIGSNSEEINYISNYLLKIHESRLSSYEDKENSYKKEEAYTKFMPYYLIITDSVDIVKKSSIINEVLSSNVNLGFSLMFLSETIDNLPNEVNAFVNLDPNISTMYESELISTNQIEFKLELPNIDLSKCYTEICNIPIDFAKGKYNLPSKYSFLEMYDVGNVNQLNITNKWKESNVTQSLSAPVGVNEEGDLFYIDLHEKAHGPHGLVAGMTGSGKSEWIITYILSMCINYHPKEVQFVLIDYKGGGLAGTFENKETGFKLPHLAGTITNLDVTEINRSLASINSELKRRQTLFNEARDSLNESSIDIYKYQRLYREGKLSEPISHLFIISDEFAELKSQQPEFMAELISTARIGRSLGVHLILATQKPSGIVDDQIWSNSKFRVCLKVQDKSDSKDMILVPDAATIKEPGRFFLQVGYNEFFAKGQSAYAGSPYYETDKHKDNIDTSIVFVNEVGGIIKEINTKKNISDAVYKGEELPFILNAIKNAADKENITIRQLWLDAIPAIILIEDLKKKYEYKKENYILNPVIGEYDIPSKQEQKILTLPISSNGNTLIYGAAGSGKEETISSIIYSLMTTYVAQEINLYLVDCGSESLVNFLSSPIVGDVVLSSDSEKIKNLIKKLKTELEKRKKLFINYNADYYYYCKNSGTTLPNILTIINNFESFNELFEEYIDDLIALTRDGEKYGIFFIITLTSASGMRIKLSQNFKQNLVLQMNDPYDYRSILNGGNRIIPSKIKCRGLVKFDDVYEMQIASITKEENIVEYIKKVSIMLKNNATIFAPKIPILPEKVNLEFIENNITDLKKLPIGVEVETLNIAYFNFLSEKYNILTSNDSELLIPYTKSIIELISTKKGILKAIVFDGKSDFTNFKDNVTHIKKNYLSALKQFDSFLDKITDQTKQTLVIFSNLNDILENDSRKKEIFNSILNKMIKINKINCLFVDQTDSLRKYFREEPILSNIEKNNGLFVGNGITNQTVLSLSKITRELNEEIADNYGYVILKGKAKKIKLLEISEIN